MTTTLLLTNLVLVVLMLHKVRKIHLASFRMEEAITRIDRESGSLFNQIQAYHALVELIQPRRPLPPLRGWAASPDFLLHVASHALAEHPQTIVECSSGASTLVLARCCELNGSGRVFSLEHDPHFARQTRERLREQGLESWATVVDAPLKPAMNRDAGPWYSTDALPSLGTGIDLLVIDGPPGDSAPLARYPALPSLYPRLSNHCAIFLDDAARKDEVEIVRRWLADFPAFNATQLQAEKGCVRLLRGTHGA